MAGTGGEEIWRSQDGTDDAIDITYAAAAAPDGGFFLAGTTQGDWGAIGEGGQDFAVTKIDSNGDLLWVWQDGSAEEDYLFGSCALEDGSVVVAGYSNGTLNWKDSIGEYDFAAVKLNSVGTVVWRWQDGTVETDMLNAAVTTADGNIVLSGHTFGDFGGTQVGSYDAAAVKLDTDGGELWRYQAGTTSADGVYIYASAARPDGSVVLAGTTYGSWSGDLSGTDAITDFVAVALDEDGQELWRWQDGSGDGYNYIYGATALVDGSVVLAGTTEGDWFGTNQGLRDFAAVKLDIDGVEEWRYQDGTSMDDEWETAAAVPGGSIILAGYTEGSWVEVNQGDGDVAALSLDAAGTTLWTYQAGSLYYDDVNMAAVRGDGSVLLAGFSVGNWFETDFTGYADMATVLLDTGGYVTPAPTAAVEPTPVSPTSPTPPTSQTSPTQPSGSVTAEATSSSSTSSVPLGVIIGSAVGGVVLLAIVAVLFRRRQVASRMDKSFGSAPPLGPPGGGASATAPAGSAPPPRYPMSKPKVGIAPAPPRYPMSQPRVGIASAPPAGGALPPPPDYFDSEPPAYDDAIRF